MSNESAARAHPPREYRIRRGTPADATALAEFGARTFFETFAAENTAEDMAQHLASAWSPALQDAELRDPLLETLLAEDAGGALAGFAQLRAEYAPACVPTRAPIELKRFYVDRPWQGRGLARALMTEVERVARGRGARELWLGVWERNVRAQAFYRKCGFEKVGTQVFVVGTDPQTDHVMLRELS
jgi:ribosomal protein S18 acetylase RimI-like enzyme